MQKMRNPACASFFEVAKQAHSVPQFYFRFFRIRAGRDEVLDRAVAYLENGR